jgi:hypothetical protein
MAFRQYAGLGLPTKSIQKIVADQASSQEHSKKATGKLTYVVGLASRDVRNSAETSRTQRSQKKKSE